MQKRAKHILFSLLLFLIGFLIYSNTFNAGFQYDDYINIIENEYVKIREVRPKPLFLAAFRSPMASRPFANMTFALNYYFVEKDLFWFHFVNTLIHCLTGLGVYLLIFHTLNLHSLRKKYGKHSFAISAFSALLFLTHPVQTAAVTYIVQRMTSMATMFYVYSLLFYALSRSGQKKTRYGLLIASICCGFLSMGSKEIALTLPLFVLFYEFVFISEFDLPVKVKRGLLFFFGGMALLFVVVLILYGPILLWQLPELFKQQDFPISQRLLTESRIVFYYLSLLLLSPPSRLNMDHDILLSTSFWDPISTFLSIAGIVILIGYAFRTLRTRPLVSFCILWYFGNLVIESSFIPLALIYEHRVYLPSIGPVLLIVSMFLGQERRLKKAGQVILLIVILCNSYFTYQRNGAWKTPVTLWEDAVRKSPNLARPHTMLGTWLIQERRYDDALLENRIALQIDPSTTRAYLNIGRVYHLQGLYDEALKTYEKAEEIDPNDKNVYYSLAELYSYKEEYVKAAQNYEKGLRLFPNNQIARNNLEMIRQKLIDQHMKNILDNPGDLESRFNLAEIYLKKEDFTLAVQEYEAILNHDERHLGALNNLASIYMKNSKFDRAEAFFKKIIQTDPKYLPALINLGMLSMQQNRPEDALLYIEEAIRLSPEENKRLLQLRETVAKKLSAP